MVVFCIVRLLFVHHVLLFIVCVVLLPLCTMPVVRKVRPQQSVTSTSLTHDTRKR